MTALAIGPQPLTRADVVAVARHRLPVRLTDEARAEMAKSREIVEALADGDEPAYGISTGFGALATRSIPAGRRLDLQRSLVRSHAAGTGPEVEAEVVRALMVLRLSTLRPAGPAPTEHGAGVCRIAQR